MIHAYKCSISSDCEEKTVSLVSRFLLTHTALFPLQRPPHCLKLLIPASNAIGRWGITVELSPECPLNRNNWFVLHKLQHAKHLLLQSRHYRFVTSQTEREEGSGIAHAHKTWTHVVSFHVGNFCVRFDSRNGRLKLLQSFWYTLYFELLAALLNKPWLSKVILEEKLKRCWLLEESLQDYCYSYLTSVP